jgi:hypothetical protein
MMMMTTFQEIPAAMTMARAVVSILQVVVGCAVQLPKPKGGQEGPV